MAKRVVYAFDVDETLDIAGGPVSMETLVRLHDAGHVVGIIGNVGLIAQRVPKWHRFISFMNFVGERSDFLAQVKRHVKASDYVVVGNVQGVSGNSDDRGVARRAGWRFIRESRFAGGVR